MRFSSNEQAFLIYKFRNYFTCSVIHHISRKDTFNKYFNKMRVVLRRSPGK